MKKINLFILLTITLLLAGCDSTPKTTSEVKDNQLHVTMDAYQQTCWDYETLYTQQNGEWQEVLDLHGTEPYYLDDLYHAVDLCDVIICQKMQQPYMIDLVEPKKTGEDFAVQFPDTKVPEYTTTNLTGEVKVEFPYFTDEECENQLTYSEVITLNSSTDTADAKYCEQDTDCACGTHIDSGNCFVGKKELVDTETQCPDFCSGFAGNLKISCENNTCVQK